MNDIKKPLVRMIFGGSDRRSIADALQMLREREEISEPWLIEMRTRPISFADKKSAVVALLARRVRDGAGWAFSLASSLKFKATTTTGVRQTYSIEELDGATCDMEGNVVLANDQHVHHVDLIHAPFHFEFTDRDHAIVAEALKFLNAFEKCYFPIDESVLPDVRVLHYDQVAQIRIEKPKQLLHHLKKCFPGEPYHRLKLTIKRSGMGFPRSDGSCTR
jgi:hypothetical protein